MSAIAPAAAVRYIHADRHRRGAASERTITTDNKEGSEPKIHAVASFSLSLRVLVIGTADAPLADYIVVLTLYYVYSHTAAISYFHTVHTNIYIRMCEYLLSLHIQKRACL